MIPRILPNGFDISTIQYDNLIQYPALTSIKSGSYAEEKLYTAEKTVTFSYPYDGDNVGLIKLGSLVVYKTSSKEPVPHVFIINEIDKYSSKMEFTVYAKSYSYLMNKDFINTCKLTSGTTAAAFVSWLNSNATTSGITVSTNIVDSLPNGFEYVGASRTKTDLIMSDSDASFKRNFACYVKRGSDNIELLTRRGSDRGEILRLRDLKELKYNISDDDLVTSVQLICDQENDGTYLSSDIVYSPKTTSGDLSHFKQITLSYDSLAREFGYDIAIAELLQLKAVNYFTDPDNFNIDVPSITITLTVDEKKDIYGKLFENYADFEFELGDRVQVISEELGISEFNEVSAVKYDGVKELVTEYVFGKVKRYSKDYFKKDYERPKNSTVAPTDPPTLPEEVAKEVTEQPETPQNNTLTYDGSELTTFFNNFHEISLAPNSSTTTPQLEFTINNPNPENSNMIIRNVDHVYIGNAFDFINPKISEVWPDNKIVGNSRAKYITYKDGYITFQFNAYINDVNTANGTSFTLADIAFDNVWVVFVTKSAATGEYVQENGSSYWGFGATVITGSGAVADDSALTYGLVSPISYLNYVSQHDIKFDYDFVVATVLLNHTNIAMDGINAFLTSVTVDEAFVDTRTMIFNRYIKEVYKMHERKPFAMTLIDYDTFIESEEYDQALANYTA